MNNLRCLTLAITFLLVASPSLTAQQAQALPVHILLDDYPSKNSGEKPFNLFVQAEKKSNDLYCEVQYQGTLVDTGSSQRAPKDFFQEKISEIMPIRSTSFTTKPFIPSPRSNNALSFYVYGPHKSTDARPLMHISNQNLSALAGQKLEPTLIQEALQVLVDPLYAHYTSENQPTFFPLKLIARYASADGKERGQKVFTIEHSDTHIPEEKKALEPKALITVPLWIDEHKRLTTLFATIFGDTVKKIELPKDLSAITREIIVTSPYPFIVKKPFLVEGSAASLRTIFASRSPATKPLSLTIVDRDIKELPRITLNNLMNSILRLTYFYKNSKMPISEKVNPLAIGFVGQRIWEPTFEKVEIQQMPSKKILFTFTKDELKKTPFTITNPLVIDDQPILSITIDNQSASDLSIKPAYLQFTARKATTSEKSDGTPSLVKTHTKETVLYAPSATVGKDYVDFDAELEKSVTLKESIIKKIRAITLTPTSAGYCPASAQTITLLNEKGQLIPSTQKFVAQEFEKPFEIIVAVKEKSSEQEGIFAASCKEVDITVVPTLPLSKPK